MSRLLTLIVLGVFMSSVGCASSASNQTSIPLVEGLDVERFTGDWYVLASIPTYFERDAFNALEQYQQDDRGRIETRFSYNKGALDGPRRSFTSTAYVSDRSNAEWGMQFVWPFRAEYLVAYLDPSYETTIVARNKRDYVWIMARDPAVSEEVYADLVARVVDMGYDISKLRKVPHDTFTSVSQVGE